MNGNVISADRLEGKDFPLLFFHIEMYHYDLVSRISTDSGNIDRKIEIVLRYSGLSLGLCANFEERSQPLLACECV